MHGTGESLQLAIADLLLLPFGFEEIRFSVQLEAAVDLLPDQPERSSRREIEEGKCVREEPLEGEAARRGLKIQNVSQLTR